MGGKISHIGGYRREVFFHRASLVGRIGDLESVPIKCGGVRRESLNAFKEEPGYKGGNNTLELWGAKTTHMRQKVEF